MTWRPLQQSLRARGSKHSERKYIDTISCCCDLYRSDFILLKKEEGKKSLLLDVEENQGVRISKNSAYAATMARSNLSVAGINRRKRKDSLFASVHYWQFYTLGPLALQ